MRATIEIPDHLRAALLLVAARKGYRGYSRVIIEAIESYLSKAEAPTDNLSKVLAMKGTWTEEETEETKRRIGKLRSNWDGGTR